MEEDGRYELTSVKYLQGDGLQVLCTTVWCICELWRQPFVIPLIMTQTKAENLGIVLPKVEKANQGDNE